jgi:hypothetical protein
MFWLDSVPGVKGISFCPVLKCDQAMKRKLEQKLKDQVSDLSEALQFNISTGLV